jgi:hypothetical protein
VRRSIEREVLDAVAQPRLQAHHSWQVVEVRAYGEVGVPKGTCTRTEVRPSDIGTRKPNEAYAIYGWIELPDKLQRVLVATTLGKDQARTVVDHWNRTHDNYPSTYTRDIETVRHYKYGERVIAYE